MQKLLVTVSAAAAALSMMANAAFATSIADRYHWTPVFVTPVQPQSIDANELGQLAGNGATIPFWRRSVKSPLNGKIYKYDMVGTSPFVAPATTTVSYVPIVLKVKFPKGPVLDPTKPGCGDTVSVADRFFGSPLFQPVSIKSNGIEVGPAQLTDAFQRANFWTTIGASPNYHVVLKSIYKKPIVLTVDAPSGSFSTPGPCKGSGHNLGEVPINGWDKIVQSVINTYAQPNQLPIVSTYNVVQTAGGCCIIGYHSAYHRPGGVQTYAVGTYNDPGIFSVPIEDIDAWTHELGEWMDDPFVGIDGFNFTPLWGHTGQVSGCQNNLEVGDPLTGTTYTVKYNGFTYHPQELVFYSWFYRVPPTGTNGSFSFNGSFGTSQWKCQ